MIQCDSLQGSHRAWILAGLAAGLALTLSLALAEAHCKFWQFKTQHFPLPKTKPGNNSNRKLLSLSKTLLYFEVIDPIHAEIDPYVKGMTRWV